MSGELAATADNFDAHIADIEMGGVDGPENDNAGPVQLESDDSPETLNPHQSRDLRDPRQARARKEAPEPEVDDGDPEDPDDPSLLDTEGDEDDEPEPEDDPDELDEKKEPAQDGEPSHEQLREMHAALMEPNLHEGLYGKMIRVSDGEREYDVPVGEMRNGYMRAKSYSRGKAEMAEATREARSVIENIRGQIKSWRESPEKLVNSMRRLIGDDALNKAVLHHGQELYRRHNMPPEQRQALEEVERLRAEREQIMQDVQRARGQMPTPQEQLLPQVHQFLEQAVPPIFQRLNIQMSPTAMNLMGNNMQSVWDGRQETVHYALENAAQATLEELQELAKAHSVQMLPGDSRPANTNAGQAKRRNKRPLGPNRLPGRAPADASGQARRGTRRGGGSASDFDAMLRRLG